MLEHMNTQFSDSGDHSPAASWPPEGLEKVSCCPVCDSEQRSLLYDDLTDRTFFCAPGSWSLYQCKRCRSAYLDPRPTPETIHLAYASYYTHTAQVRMAAEGMSAARRLVRALANGYRNKRYGAAYQPALPLGWLVMRLMPPYCRSIDAVYRFLPPIWPGARVLDVGFGDGTFLELAAELGWEVAGVDPDTTVVDAARRRGLNVRRGGIEAFDDEPASFDFITMSHVIEHVHDPEETLSHALRLLRPGGQLYLDTPNLDAAGHARFRQHWRGLEVPRHLILFTHESLRNILQRVGFAQIKRMNRAAVYPALAAESRAIQAGADPSANPVISMRDRLVDALAAARPKASDKRSEFITLIAQRPHE
jgi:2-polyprenyl-3-methyl-5-hydroxy-6-metoxy-1,4-benzoquinol methylase